jgi:hypothetical protein
MWDAVLLNQIGRMLTMQHDIPGAAKKITVVTGVYRSLQLLTWMLKHTDFDFTQSAVEHIYAIGGHINSRWRDIVREAWGAHVIPVYSMTEVCGHANLCQECHAYHFLPNVIPELVHPLNLSECTSYAGELLLTALFPFQQGQPAIRYATGDLFRRATGRCPHGEGFTFLGRKAQSWILDLDLEGALVIGAAEVIDILDSICDIVRAPFLEGLPGIRGEAEIGRPSCAIRCTRRDNGTAHFRIDAELRYDPFLFPGAALRCSDEIRARLSREVPGVEQGLRESRIFIEVQCRAPGWGDAGFGGGRIGERAGQ